MEVDLVCLWKDGEVSEVSDRAEGRWLYLTLKQHSRSTTGPLQAFLHVSGTGASHAVALLTEAFLQSTVRNLWVQGQCLATILGPPKGTRHLETCQPDAAPQFLSKELLFLEPVSGAFNHSSIFPDCDRVVCNYRGGRSGEESPVEWQGLVLLAATLLGSPSWALLPGTWQTAFNLPPSPCLGRALNLVLAHEL